MKRKQNIFLFGTIFALCASILFVCSFLMPDKPSYQTSDAGETLINDGNNENNQNDENIQDTTPIGTVVIDPGHGGYDEGASSEDGRIVEKVFDLKVALKLKEVLEEKNVTVIMTRTDDNVTWSTDNGKDLQARLDIATKANADLMVSIHCNVSDEDIYNVSGSEVYANAEQKKSTKLANLIVDELDKLEPQLPSRGVKTGVLHLTLFNKVPTVIVEMGFVSNPKDVEYLLAEETQSKLIDAMANGIINYLKD